MPQLKKIEPIRTGKWSLSRKLAFSIFFSMFISLVFGISTLYLIAQQSLVEMNDNLNENNLVGARYNINQLVLAVEDEVTIAFLDTQFRSGIMSPTQTFNDSTLFNLTKQLTVRSKINMPYVCQISILKTNGANFFTDPPVSGLGFKNYDDCLGQLAKSRNVLTDWGGVTGWYSCFKNPSSNPDVYCFVHMRKILDVNAIEYTAAMLVYLDETAICDLYSYFGKDSFMMDKSGTVISSQDKERIGTSVNNTDLYSEVIHSGQDTISGNYTDTEGKRSFSCTYLPSLSSYIIAVPDYKISGIVQKAILIDAFFLILFGTFISFLLAALLAKRMTTPIARLKHAMTQVRNGNLSTRFSGGDTDEITYLGTSFNILMDTMEEYISSIREKEEEKRQGELRFLQAQINPHLLYNTLDSALYLLSKNEVKKACGSIEALSEFFKLSLSKGRVFVSIETELNHVKQYMEIQRLCRDKNIKLEVLSEEHLLKREIVKMTLQPIVENSYLHAFTGEIDTGTIRIEIREENRQIIITVTDDGMGMDEKELSDVQSRLLNLKESGQGFGLWNVNRRLKKCYGEDFGISIDSEFGEYTKVTVTISSREGDSDV